MNPPELYQYQQLATVLLPVAVSDPAPSMDWLRNTEIPPADVEHPNVGGSFYVYDPGVQSVSIDWYLVQEAPVLEAERGNYSDPTTPWLSTPAYNPVLPDWQATPPDPIHQLPEPNAGFFVWHIADWVRPLEWIPETSQPLFDAQWLPDYTGFAQPGDPLNPQLTPLPSVESAAIWPPDAAIDTAADVFSQSIGTTSLEWQPQAEIPVVADPPTPEEYAVIPLTVESLAFTWWVPASEPVLEDVPPLATDAAYVQDIATGLGGLGWQQPMVEQVWPDFDPIISATPALFIELSTAPAQSLQPDDRDASGNGDGINRDIPGRKPNE